MGVNREEYIIIGCKFDRDFTQRLFDREDYDDFNSEHEWSKGDEKKIKILSDGMSGDYTFLGYILQIGDGYDENADSIEFKPVTKKQEEKILEKFTELFPQESRSLAQVKMYYTPHYC